MRKSIALLSASLLAISTCLTSCKKTKIEPITEATPSTVTVHFESTGSTNSTKLDGKIKFLDLNDNLFFSKDLNIVGVSKVSFDTTFTTTSDNFFGEIGIFVMKNATTTPDLDTQCTNKLSVMVDGVEVMRTYTHSVLTRFKAK